MVERPKNVRCGGSGEAAAAPDATCTARRHGGSRADYQAGCRCSVAVAANRTYYRDYNRAGRELTAWRERQNEYARRRKAKILADPARRAAYNAQRRAWARRQRRSDELARRLLVDFVVVDRLAAGAEVEHNRAERLEAVRLLRTRETSYPQIAELLHITERQVHRDMTYLGLINSTGAAA